MGLERLDSLAGVTLRRPVVLYFAGRARDGDG
jgi:hypothetical protein